MGKSDSLVFREYLNVLDGIEKPSNVAFLGFSGENYFTSQFVGCDKEFYDLQLGNWEINSDWNLGKRYDLLISTRCPYFSKNPENFVHKCKEHLNPGGHALLDWGLGDHWRFENYKIGWVRNGEQEFAYQKENFLHSCFWNDELLTDKSVLEFWNHVSSNPKFGYYPHDSLKTIVEKEVPFLVSYATEKTSCLFLWPEKPQLYITTLVKNSAL